MAATASRATFVWRGQQFKQRVHDASRKALTATLADAVTESSAAAPRDTGAMANSLTWKILVDSLTLCMGAFGSWTVAYTIWQEIGFAVKHKDGSVTVVPGKFFLRTAAQTQFPTLPERIKEFFNDG